MRKSEKKKLYELLTKYSSAKNKILEDLPYLEFRKVITTSDSKKLVKKNQAIINQVEKLTPILLNEINGII